MLELARILLSAPDTEGVETTYYSYRVEEEESFSAAVNLEGRQGKQWRDSLHKWLKVKLPGLFFFVVQSCKKGVTTLSRSTSNDLGRS